MNELFIDKKQRVVALPQLFAPVADTHCHLLSLDDLERGSGDLALYKSAADALCRAYFAGLAFIVVVTDPAEDYTDPQEAFDQLARIQADAKILIEEHIDAGWEIPHTLKHLPKAELLPQHIKVISGCHPHNASAYNSEIEDRLLQYANHSDVVAIGEIGLDYFYDLSPRDVQKRVFERQIALAKELKLPIALHVRDAHDDAYEILNRVGLPKEGCLLHCFNLGPEIYKKFESLGCKFSIGGPLTFSKAGLELREAMSEAELTNLLSETDSPYMAPAPFRGFKCEPAFTVFTMQKFLDIFTERGFSAEHVCKMLYENALNFYSK